MKNVKIFAAAALAAIVSFSACSKEEVTAPEGGDETTSVKIDFSYPEGAVSRAEAAGATAGAATFQPGHIIFASTSGQIDKHVGVGNSAGSEQVTVADLTTANTVVIEGISSSATQCYILSNDAAVFTGTDAISGNLEGSNINTILARQITVAAINGATDLSKVPMYGFDVVTPQTGTSVGSVAYTAAVDVDINSLASRIQIGKIIANDYTAPAPSEAVTKIKSFTVEGIYINNTFDKMTFASTVAATPEISNASLVTDYSKTVGTTDYIATGTANLLADEPAAVAAADAGNGGKMTAETVTPANFWAYNVFPKGTPHIIVKLSNITYTITPKGGSEGAVQTVASDQWLTINSYKSGGSVLTAFAANNIYSIGGLTGGLEFDFDDLTDVPYTTKLNALVEVNMFNWIDTPLVWNN